MATVTVTTAPDLAAAVIAAQPGDTILLVPNTYVLAKGLDLNKPGLTLAQVDGAPDRRGRHPVRRRARLLRSAQGQRQASPCATWREGHRLP
jgi:hypothetical protein